MDFVQCCDVTTSSSLLWCDVTTGTTVLWYVDRWRSLRWSIRSGSGSSWCQERKWMDQWVHLIFLLMISLSLFPCSLCVYMCVCMCMCVCAMYVLCSVDPISSLQSVLWFNIGSVESFERSLENAQVEMNIEPANYVSVIYKTETEMWDPVQFFSRVLPFFSFFAWWPVGILDILGCSGRVVWLWSFDFYPASLKSLGCFYFWWVLSSQWKAERVNLWSLQCQL